MASADTDPDVMCTITDPVLEEISGLAYSPTHPDVIWAHNDSGGGPVLIAVSTTTCDVLAQVKIRDVKATDFEAMGSTIDAEGVSTLWVADIGDNTGTRSKVTLHRIIEPAELIDQSVSAQSFDVKYDEPQDAESLIVGAEGLWILSKGLINGTVWELPLPLRTDSTNRAKAIGAEEALATDAAMAPDGEHYAVRDYTEARIYLGTPVGVRVSRLPLPAQVQGEAMTWAPDGASLVVASEGDPRLLRVALPADAQAPPPADVPDTAPSEEVPALDPEPAPDDESDSPSVPSPSGQPTSAVTSPPAESSAEDSAVATSSTPALVAADQIGSLSLIALAAAGGVFVLATAAVVVVIVIRDRQVRD